MRGIRLFVASFLVLAFTFCIIPADVQETEAISVDENNSTWYCYGDNPIFIFPRYSEGVDVEWDIIDETNDEKLNTVSVEGNYKVTVNLSGHDYVQVTQTVSAANVESKSLTIHVIGLHLQPGDEYTVTFHDGQYSEKQTVDNTTVVSADNYHVFPPLVEKDGYTHLGWFLSDFTTEFDPKKPITSDIDVYAKWLHDDSSGGSSGGIGSTIVGTYVVTFNTAEGIEYTTSLPASNSLRFNVGLVGGYAIDGEFVVSANGGTLTKMAEGEYLLSGINSNIVVTISGDTHPIQSPDDDVTDDNPNDPVDVRNNDYTMYAIILVIVAIICIALAVYIMRTRGSRV